MSSVPESVGTTGTIGYSSHQYQIERATGQRNPNGTRPLKRLSAVHRQMIQLHLSGLPGSEIAERTGKTQASVSRILNDPLAQREIDRVLRETDQEFAALYTQGVRVIREALDATTVQNKPAHNTRLKAADMLLKAQGKYQDSEGRETAEDVVKQIVNVYGDIYNSRPDPKPSSPIGAKAVEDAEASSGEIIEGEFDDGG